MYKRFLTAFIPVLGLIARADSFTVETTGAATDRCVTVTAVTGNIIRVSNTPAGEAAPDSRFAILDPEQGVMTVTNGQSRTTFETTGGISGIVDRATGAVTLMGGAGRIVHDNGVRLLADGRQELTLTTSGDESFYGGGERGHSINLAGDTLINYNRATYGYGKGDSRISQMNITMPLAVSSNGYALLFDDYSTSELILSNPIKYITEADQPVSYYFIDGGGTVAGAVNQFTNLVGRQQMPPLWALGYITSRYGYRTDRQTVAVADSLRRAGYPLDGIVLDLYWFGEEQDMGCLDWEPSTFGNHTRMLSDLRKRGVNTVTISEPFILRNGKGIDNYNYLSDNRMLITDSLGNTGKVTIWVGDGGMLDVSNPQTRQWLSDRYLDMARDGVASFWGDLGEPEAHPDSLYHSNGLKARLYHNIYGNDWASIISEMFAANYPGTRYMTLMRGGTVGLQRHNVFPWSGDVSRSWAGLQAQIPIMLNSGLSGLGYMSHDVGGFAVDHNNPIDPEMYVRWLQLGLYTPTLRTHAQLFAEPYNYPDQQDILLPIIRQRYANLPYTYNLAFENAAYGYPMVRPLGFYDRGNGSDFDAIDDQYLWGRDQMIAPVLTPGTTTRRVVFPSGEWIDPTDADYASHVYTRGDTIIYDAPLNVIPRFVRAGAFIPSASYKMKNTGDYRTDNYTIDYYPTMGESDGYIFEDDLTAPDLADSRVSMIKLHGQATSDGISVRFSPASPDGSYPTDTKKDITLRIHGVDPDTFGNYTAGGIRGKIDYDRATKTVTTRFTYNPANTITLSFDR